MRNFSQKRDFDVYGFWRKRVQIFEIVDFGSIFWRFWSFWETGLDGRCLKSFLGRFWGFSWVFIKIDGFLGVEKWKVGKKSYPKSSCFLKNLKKTINTAIIRTNRKMKFTIHYSQLFGYTFCENRHFGVF